MRTLADATTGQDVRVFCTEGADDHGAVNVETVPADPEHRRILLQRLRAFGPDLIEHHQQVKQAVFLTRAAPQAAHVLYRHNALKPPRNPLDAWRYDARYARLDGFVFVSEAERARFASACPRFAPRAWAVPNPIDAGPWLAPIDPREPVIAFCGRAMPQKGLDIVCAALPDVLERHRDWRAVLMLGHWNDHRAWAAPHLAMLNRFGPRVTILRPRRCSRSGAG